jgi:hypothetical protein
MCMFDGLTMAIEELHIPISATALAEVLALRDRLVARIAEAAAEFDALGLWDVDGSTSMTAWLKSSASMTSKSARRFVSMAGRLRRLPVCAAAFRAGRLSGGHVEVIVANLDDASVDHFAEAEDELVPYLAPLTTAGCSRAMAAWKEQSQQTTEPAERERSLFLSSTLDGRHVLQGHLDAEGGAVVAAALRLATVDDPDRTPAERRADAMVEVNRFYLDHQQSRTAGRHRPHLNVVVDLEALQEHRGGRVVDGPRLDGVTISRLVCDSAVHRVLTRGRSAILDYGVATRTIPATLWSALVIRDEHCRFPGCDRPSSWGEGHHVRWVTNGGTTELDNLVLVCSRHHHRLHQPDWQAKLLPDATFEVTDPDGMVRATSPPRSQPGW